MADLPRQTNTQPAQKDVSVRVVAYAPGTYQEPGQPRAFFREIGDIFTISSRKQFSKAWMRELKDGEAPVLAIPDAKIPQTTAPLKPITGDFPPVHPNP